MSGEKEMPPQPSNEDLVKENRSLKRQLRNLESTFQRNKAMLAARTTVNHMLEAEQRKMERNMNLLLENSADIILLFDKNSRFSYFTKTFLKTTGLTDFNQISGKYFFDIFSQLVSKEWIEFMQTNIDLALETRSTVIVNSSIDLSGGENLKEYDIQITPMMDRDGHLEAFMILLHDITDIMMSKRQAESANTAKSQFLATVSHEMRTPMNAVIGMASIGKNSADKERMIYCFSEIENASQHLLAVINDVLDMSKIEAGRLELSPTNFIFEKMIRRIVNMINPRAAEKKQNLNIHLDGAIPISLIGDEQRIAQVITNLLANAVKFTPDGGSIDLDIRLLGEQSGICEIQVAVTDTGIGISPEQQSHLFQPFHQAESDTSRRFGGTGLGLSISRNIVQMMGGEIKVVSELEKGSSFIFTIPLKKSIVKNATINNINDWENICLLEADDDEYVDFAGKCILLADDVAINREIVLALLEPMHMQIDCAENGAEAVRMFNERPDRYSLIFMDIQMPEMDGYEATRKIRESKNSNAKAIPIIAMTANVFREDIEKCIEAGMNDHVGKPLSFDELIQQLKLHL